MANNAAVRLPVVWPGSSSQLAAGDGSAVTVSPASALSGGVLTVGGSHGAVDANHTAAWNLDESAGPFANSVAGGGSLTWSIASAFSSWTGPIYANLPCAGPSSASTVMGASAAGTHAVPAAQDVSVELVFRLMSFGMTGSDAYFLTHIDANNGVFLAYINSGGTLTYGYRRSGTSGTIAVSPGGAANQFQRNAVHHAMITWSGSSVVAYLDGEVVGTASPGARTAQFSDVQLNVSPGAYYSDLRVSNVARNITYARKAFARLVR